MQNKLTFFDGDVFVTSSQGNTTLSPFFYYRNGRVIVGNQVKRGIELLPESIFNPFSPRLDEKKLGAYLYALHEYMIQTTAGEDYMIEVEAKYIRLRKWISVILPDIKIHTLKSKKKQRLLDATEEDVLLQALTVTIANGVIRKKGLYGRLIHDVHNIIRLRAGKYCRKLMENGEAIIQLKVVDEMSTVITLRERVSGNVPAIANILELFKNPEMIEGRLAEALYGVHDENFKVTFISPFSYGKSTLINALLGREILNMDIRAETAIVTKVVSAQENRLLVKYRDNRIVMYDYIDDSDLKLKLSGLTGVRSEQLPLEVQIQCRVNDFPGITLIDAPGLNSRHADHNAKAVEALNMSDLILFMVNPAQIGEAHFTRQMQEFLSIIKETGKQYGIVISRLDQHKDSFEKIMNEMDIVLDDLDPEFERGRLFFVSGYFALYGKLLRDRKIDLTKVRKSSTIYVIEDDEVLSGRSIESHHFVEMLSFSQISQLENFIRQGGKTNASDEFDLDHGKRKAARKY